MVHLILIFKELSDHLYLSEIFFKLVLSHGVSYNLLHVELVFFGIGQSSEGLLFVVDFLLELSFEPFVDFIAEESLLGTVVVNQIGLEAADKADFSDLFLSLHALSDFVLFGEV